MNLISESNKVKTFKNSHMKSPLFKAQLKSKKPSLKVVQECKLENSIYKQFIEVNQDNAPKEELK